MPFDEDEFRAFTHHGNGQIYNVLRYRSAKFCGWVEYPGAGELLSVYGLLGKKRVKWMIASWLSPCSFGYLVTTGYFTVSPAVLPSIIQ